MEHIGTGKNISVMTWAIPKTRHATCDYLIIDIDITKIGNRGHCHFLNLTCDIAKDP